MKLKLLIWRNKYEKERKKVIIQHSESLEKFKTDLSEYAFILEQQYKKKSYTSTTQEEKNMI